ncbi:MAG: class I SAM-dependent methyltransferase [Pseudomonadota bacterium]|nr:MAG: class I SAM-dependent methyltransferase [Pseudomonadota bacterium]
MTNPSNHPASRLAPHPTLQDYYQDGSRRAFISDIFDKTAHHYDWIIRAMSLGSGDWYRKQALVRAGLAQGMDVLDVATGTGPVAQAAREMVGESGSVTGLDRSINMLRNNRMRSTLPMVQSDAARLPFPDQSFDFLSMGYALRHVDDLGMTFAEYHRVLRPGGKVLLLELTRPDSRIGTGVARFYLRTIVPRVARLGCSSKDAQLLMEYFWDTVEQCVRPAAILEALTTAGFAEVKRGRQIGVFSEYSALRAAMPAA